MSKNTSFVLGAIVAFTGVAFGAHMIGGSGTSAQGKEEPSKAEISAKSLDLPIYISTRKAPLFGIQERAADHSVDPKHISTQIMKIGDATTNSAVVDLLYNDRRGLGELTFGDLVYSNHCRFVDGAVSAEIVQRAPDKIPFAAEKSSSGQVDSIAQMQCSALLDKGVISFE